MPFGGSIIPFMLRREDSPRKVKSFVLKSTQLGNGTMGFWLLCRGKRVTSAQCLDLIMGLSLGSTEELLWRPPGLGGCDPPRPSSNPPCEPLEPAELGMHSSQQSLGSNSWPLMDLQLPAMVLLRGQRHADHV